MLRVRNLTRASIVAAVMAGGVLVLAQPAQAIGIPVACSESALVAAVTLANSTTAADTLTLAGGCTYALTSAHGGTTDGLPAITTPIEMIGPATITRAATARFRIIEVGSTGSLTLTTSVAITNGNTSGSGGGILNHGAVTLTNSSLSGNTARVNGGGLANADTLLGTAPAATFTNSPVSGNSAGFYGGGLYNGVRSTLTVTGVSGTPLPVTGNTAGVGGGIAVVNSTTTLTQTAVSANSASSTAGGVYRQNGVMTTTSSPISANTPNNCVGSSPAVPTCTG